MITFYQRRIVFYSDFFLIEFLLYLFTTSFYSLSLSLSLAFWWANCRTLDIWRIHHLSFRELRRGGGSPNSMSKFYVCPPSHPPAPPAPEKMWKQKKHNKKEGVNVGGGRNVFIGLRPFIQFNRQSNLVCTVCLEILAHMKGHMKFFWTGAVV